MNAASIEKKFTIVQQWQVPPGMGIFLVEGPDHRHWIVESCPVGTHTWAPRDAARLFRGDMTGPAIHEALKLARRLERANRERQRLVRTRLTDVEEDRLGFQNAIRPRIAGGHSSRLPHNSRSFYIKRSH